MTPGTLETIIIVAIVVVAILTIVVVARWDLITLVVVNYLTSVYRSRIRGSVTKYDRSSIDVCSLISAFAGFTKTGGDGWRELIAHAPFPAPYKIDFAS